MGARDSHNIVWTPELELALCEAIQRNGFILTSADDIWLNGKKIKMSRDQIVRRRAVSPDLKERMDQAQQMYARAAMNSTFGMSIEGAPEDANPRVSGYAKIKPFDLLVIFSKMFQKDEEMAHQRQQIEHTGADGGPILTAGVTKVQVILDDGTLYREMLAAAAASQSIKIVNPAQLESGEE